MREEIFGKRARDAPAGEIDVALAVADKLGGRVELRRIDEDGVQAVLVQAGQFEPSER